MNRLSGRSLREAGIPLAAIVAILMLVIPMPAALLDVLLLANIALSVGVLILTLSVGDALELASFPTLLLLATLFRLALEVTATRLILLEANAGNVIATFGRLVVGGNLVVGLIVFLILVVIQFLVITRGAERVSEVSARFTLDAMPGKQLAVDQELQAGRIGDAEAKRRREAIEREADFYGAMDGASKFVRGDAVAGLIIVAINLVGGLLIGMVEQHQPFGSAIQTYSILTVGEGLTTQIPALLFSTATGFLVTRGSGGEGSASAALASQLLSSPRALYLVALVLALLALLGVPPLVPLLLAAAAAGLGWRLERARQAQAARDAEQRLAAQRQQANGPEAALRQIGVDQLELEVGEGLVGLLGGAGGQALRDRIAALRQRVAAERGLLLPPIRVRDNLELGLQQYRIRVRGGTVAEGTLVPDRLLAMGGNLDGITQAQATKDPVFGAPAAWIPPTARARAELQGATVLDAPTILLTHLSEVIRRHAWELLSREITKQLIDHVRASHPTVVSELIPDLLSLGEVQQVLQQLLREDVSLRNLPAILETLADRARATRAVDQLTDAVRQALARSLVEPYLYQGQLWAWVLAPGLEGRLLESLVETPSGPVLAPAPPEVAQQLFARLQASLQQAPAGVPVVLLASPGLRYGLRRLIERPFPRLPVLASTECPPDLPLRILGRIDLEAAATA